MFYNRVVFIATLSCVSPGVIASLVEGLKALLIIHSRSAHKRENGSVIRDKREILKSSLRVSESQCVGWVVGEEEDQCW